MRHNGIGRLQDRTSEHYCRDREWHIPGRQRYWTTGTFGQATGWHQDGHMVAFMPESGRKLPSANQTSEAAVEPVAFHADKVLIGNNEESCRFDKEYSGLIVCHGGPTTSSTGSGPSHRSTSVQQRDTMRAHRLLGHPQEEFTREKAKATGWVNGGHVKGARGR